VSGGARAATIAASPATYNTRRPHSSLGMRAPAAFAAVPEMSTEPIAVAA